MSQQSLRAAASVPVGVIQSCCFRMNGGLRRRYGGSHREQRQMKYLLAADTGGTFTDVVVHDSVSGRTEFGKRLTNYENLVAGVTEGLQDTHATLDDAQLLKHGTT